jgi:hypothetical protein
LQSTEITLDNSLEADPPPLFDLDGEIFGSCPTEAGLSSIRSHTESLLGGVGFCGVGFCGVCLGCAVTVACGEPDSVVREGISTFLLPPLLSLCVEKLSWL